MALNVCMMTFLRLTTQSLRYRHDLGVVGLDYTLDSLCITCKIWDKMPSSHSML